MNLRSWSVAGLLMAAGVVAGHGQATTFTRPGTMVVTNLIGNAVAIAEGNEKPLKVEERARAEVTLKTERRSTVTFELSNGSTMKLGSESEILVDEFWQQPHSIAGKAADWKEEPSPSRTRLRVIRGDVTLNVKPLKTPRGSSFTVETIAGAVRITQGTLLARVQMTELGLGLCTLELQEGAAEFERVGGGTVPLPVGRRMLLAIETDAAGGVKVSDAPRADDARK